MKMRNKGKVHPSSSSAPFPPTGDSLSVLNLLPAAILSLAVVLSLEDRQVLAYMITRSIKSTNPNGSKKGLNAHKSPVFECDCFDCYTTYWFRWDTSPNRELIHQAIEAFEENLTSSEQVKKKGKKKEKTTHRRFPGKAIELPEQYDVASHRRLAGKTIELENDVASHRRFDGGTIDLAEQNDVASYSRLARKSIEREYDVALVEPEGEECVEAKKREVEERLPETTVVVTTATAAVSQQRGGVGRKVVPDVIGLLNWRLWSIWSPK